MFVSVFYVYIYLVIKMWYLWEFYIFFNYSLPEFIFCVHSLGKTVVRKTFRGRRIWQNWRAKEKKGFHQPQLLTNTVFSNLRVSDFSLGRNLGTSWGKGMKWWWNDENNIFIKMYNLRFLKIYKRVWNKKGWETLD